MHSDDLDRTLPALFSELVYGAPETETFVLNRGDRGLLKSLDLLSADEASASRDGSASIAAHIRHVAYGLSLMNRWALGENPFTAADWSAAWEGGTGSTVSDATAFRGSTLNLTPNIWRSVTI